MLHNDNPLHKYSGIWWFGIVISFKLKIDGSPQVLQFELGLWFKLYFQLGQGFVKTSNFANGYFVKQIREMLTNVEKEKMLTNVGHA